MEILIVTVVLLYFLSLRALIFVLFFRKSEHRYVRPPSVVFPTIKGEERPKELEELYKKIQEATVGPPLVGEEVDMGVV